MVAKLRPLLVVLEGYLHFSNVKMGPQPLRKRKNKKKGEMKEPPKGLGA
jgi:hypothetical protein